MAGCRWCIRKAQEQLLVVIPMYVFMKKESEQFQSTPINLLEVGQKYLLINSVKPCKEIQ